MDRWSSTRSDRPVMGGRDGVTDLVWPERPEKGDALGGRERQVVAGASFLGQPGSQVVPGGGPAGEQVPERLGVDLADEPELFGCRADPLARCFTPPEVVVVDVVGDLVEVVLGAAGGCRAALSTASRRLAAGVRWTGP